MTIAVRFPDGSVRDVPSELRPVHDGAPDAPPRFRHVPLDCDGRWIFVEKDGRWRARARHGSLAILSPQPDPWWQGIATMDDALRAPEGTVRSPRAA